MITDFPYINRYSHAFIDSQLFATPLLLDNEGTFYSMAFEHASRLEVRMSSESLVRIGTGKRMVDVTGVTKLKNLVGSSRAESIATDLIFQHQTAFTELLQSYGLRCSIASIPKAYLPTVETSLDALGHPIDETKLRQLYDLDNDMRRVIIAPEYPFRYADPCYLEICSNDIEHADEIINFVRFCAGYLPQFIDDSDCNREIARLNALIASLQDRINELEADDPRIDELEKQISELNARISNLQTTISLLESEVVDKDRTIAQLTRDKVSMQSEIQRLESIISDLRAQLAQLSDEHQTETLRVEIGRLNGIITNLRGQLDNANAQIAALRAHVCPATKGASSASLGLTLAAGAAIAGVAVLSTIEREREQRGVSFKLKNN